ncbi:MAG: hypothetical protein KAJ29_06775 [Alphaproteobacteria bacterium]|nr:hypothetical protein [Alphaproteobacteria bacterium]
MNNTLYRKESNIHNLIIAILIPPFLISSPFCFISVLDKNVPYIVSTLLFFVALVVYSSLAIPTYRYAVRNNKKAFPLFALIGTIGGIVAGAIFFYIFGGVHYKGDEIDVNMFPLAGGSVGMVVGFSFSYFFWACAIKKGVRSIIFSTLILVLFVFVPTLYTSLK